MPEWQTKLGNERIILLAAYVYSLSDSPVPTGGTSEAAAEVAVEDTSTEEADTDATVTATEETDI